MEFTKKFVLAAAIAVTPFLSAAMQTQMTTANQDTPALQGDVLKKNQYPAAYNAQACYQIKDRGQDWFAQASFLYWYVGQEGMELAVSAGVSLNDATTPFSNETESPHAHNLFQKFEYSPGFKVGLGFNFNQQDNWVGYFEYTRIHSETHVSKKPIHNKKLAATGKNVWIPLWYIQGTPGNSGSSDPQSFNSPMPALHVRSTWHVGIDYLDATIGRPYYLSRKVVINPYFGVRLAWSEQTLRLTCRALVGEFGLQPYSSDGRIRSNNKSESWALGPRGCIGAHWLLGGGWRLDGNAGASLLFTRFTDVKHTEQAFTTASADKSTTTFIHNYNTVRPWIEGGLGLAWGSYIYNAAYHIDLSATYDFNYIWGQNMMRKLLQMNSFGTGNTVSSSSSAGDLYMHGLTLTGRFDF